MLLGSLARGAPSGDSTRLSTEGRTRGGEREEPVLPPSCAARRWLDVSSPDARRSLRLLRQSESRNYSVTREAVNEYARD